MLLNTKCQFWSDKKKAFQSNLLKKLVFEFDTNAIPCSLVRICNRTLYWKFEATNYWSFFSYFWEEKKKWALYYCRTKCNEKASWNVPFRIANVSALSPLNDNCWKFEATNYWGFFPCLKKNKPFLSPFCRAYCHKKAPKMNLLELESSLSLKYSSHKMMTWQN